MGVFSVIGGIIVMMITFYMNASPVFWLFFGAGIPHISSWTVWAFIICAPISVAITRWRNKKIEEKTSGMTQSSQKKDISQSLVNKEMYCPKCGTEIKSRYIFCIKCGEPVKNMSSQDNTKREKCSSCGFENQPGDIYCEKCGEEIIK